MKTSTLLLALAVPAMTILAQPTLLDASADPVPVFRGRNLRTAGFGKWYRDKFDIGEGDSAIHAKHWLHNFGKKMNGANRVEIAELLAKQVEVEALTLAQADYYAKQYVFAQDKKWPADRADILRQVLLLRPGTARAAIEAQAAAEAAAQAQAQAAGATAQGQATIQGQTATSNGQGTVAAAPPTATAAVVSYHPIPVNVAQAANSYGTGVNGTPKPCAV